MTFMASMRIVMSHGSLPRKMLEEDFQKMDEYGFRYMAYPYSGYNDLMLEAIGKSKIKMAFTFKRAWICHETLSCIRDSAAEGDR